MCRFVIFRKKYNDGSKLVIPSDAMTQFVLACEAVFWAKFEKVMHSPKPRLKLANYINSVVIRSLVLCPNAECNPLLDYIINLYLTVRICRVLDLQNEAFQEKGRSRNRKILKLKHV